MLLCSTNTSKVCFEVLRYVLQFNCLLFVMLYYEVQMLPKVDLLFNCFLDFFQFVSKFFVAVLLFTILYFYFAVRVLTVNFL